MKKNNVAKRSLFMSALALLLCCSMLVGTTFAWFTDEVVSDRNIIAAGNLDVVLEYAPMENGTFGTYTEVTDQVKVFKEGALYEPGYTELVKFRVTNAGSLALKYVLNALVYTEKEGVNVDGDPFKLSEHLYTGLVDANAYTTREAAVAYATDPLNTGYNLQTDGTLLQTGESKEFILVVTMPTTVGNVANHKTGEEFQPQITLGVKLQATQFTEEKDSFNNQYDIFADYDGEISNEVSFQAAAQNGGTYKVKNDIQLKEPAAVGPGKTLNLDLNGNNITAGDDGYVLNNEDGGTVVIGDASAASTFSLRRSAVAGTINGTIYNGVGGTMIVYNGNFTTTGKYVLLNQGDMTINGGTVVAGSSYPIYSYGEGHKLTINDVNVEATFGCVNAYNPGQVEINGGTFTMTGVQGKTSHLAYFSSNVTATINGGTFEKIGDISMSATGGGGICAIYGGKLTINGGSFCGDYADLYNWGGEGTAITVKGGTFTYALPSGTLAAGYSTITNANGKIEVIDTNGKTPVAGATGVYTDESGNYYLYTAEAFLWMEAQADDFFARKTVYMMQDVDLAGLTIKPTKMWNPGEQSVFDGQGHTIKNLNITSEPSGNNQGLFNGTVDVKNVTVDGAVVSGNGYVGVLGGNVYGSFVNCHVKNAQVNANYWQVGGIVGQFNNVLMSGCSIADSEITGPSAVGALAGIITDVNSNAVLFENCEVKSCQIKQNYSFGAVYDVLYGVMLGCGNVSGVTYSFNNCNTTDVTFGGEAFDVLCGEADTIIIDGVTQ